MAWAGIGLRTSPQVEDTLGMVPTQQEKDDLDRKLSLRISRVDKEANNDRPWTRSTHVSYRFKEVGDVYR